jgi:hypothetical protein
MSGYGESAFLNDELDLEIDDSGDIKTTNQTRNASEELEKDLAYMTIAALTKETGEPINPVTEARLEKVVRDVIESDARVEQVTNIRITESISELDIGTNKDEYSIEITLTDRISSTEEIDVQI